MIKHVVMWKFKESEKEKMQEFLNGLKSLEGQIEEIKSMQVGISLKEDNEYDAILISEFENMEELQKYKEDPRHVKVSNLCKEIRIKRTAIDFEE